MPLIQRFETKLEGWKGKFISRGGRLQLVNSVLSSIPIYFMACFQLPIWVIKRLDKVRRGFLWGKNDGNKIGISLINWNTVCSPKKWGGMVVYNLRFRNISLLLRWWWRLHTNFNCLWTEKITILKKKTELHGSARWLKTGTFFWGALAGIKQLFILSIQKVDGTNQIIWRWEINGQYLAKSAYDMLMGAGKIAWPYIDTWRYKVPPTVRIFIYLLLRKRLLTRKLMVTRGFNCSLNCETCASHEIESVMHLFFKCPKAVHLWDRMAKILGVRLMSVQVTVRDTWNKSVLNAANSGMGKNSGRYTSSRLAGLFGSNRIKGFLKEKKHH